MKKRSMTGGLVELDGSLLREAECLCDGENVHHLLNLVAGYKGSIREFLDSRDPRFLLIAREAERALRACLFEMRLRKFLFAVTPNPNEPC